MNRPFLITISLIVLCLSKHIAAENIYKLTIDLSRKLHSVPPTLFGIFLEDINHTIDGGLYAQLVRNGSFEHTNSLEGWSVDKSSGVQIGVEQVDPLNQNNKNYLRACLEKPQHVVRIVNKGYDGIYLERNKEYLFSICAKAKQQQAQLNVSIQDSTGQSYFTKALTIASADWQKHQFTIQTSDNISNGAVVLTIHGPADVALDMISLIPNDSFMGVMRNDLVKMLSDLQPGFVRFPGGCLVEGYSLENAYRWKDTIGSPENRKAKPNLWGYHQSYGIGFDEYFSLSRSLGAEPVPIFNAGISCQVRGAQIASLDQMDCWIQDAIDLIEYANGDSKTTWGAKRIENGLIDPVNLKYVGIGNENWGSDYREHFKLFQRKIKERYPQIKLIFSCPPNYEGPSFDEAWLWARNNGVDIVDEHIYASYEWFLANANRYDEYDRSGPKVMVGEYAVHTIGKRNNLQAALGEAAFMTGLERNSDVVIMAAYAPLLNRVGWSQWIPDLIWFNGLQVYVTPSYYVQKLFMNNLPDVILFSSLEEDELDDRITGKVGLGTWKTISEFDYIRVWDRDGNVLLSDDFDGNAKSWQTYRGNWSTTNGLLIQTSTAQDRRIYLGQADRSDYTIEVRARKKEGSEGFLILFGVKDNNNYYWWNVGGFQNTSSVIEKALNGNRMLICSTVPRTVISGEWYTLKVEVSGKRIKCYLNGELVHDVIDEANYRGLYYSAGYDFESEEIVLKVVNPRPEGKKVIVDILNAELVHQVKTTILTAESVDLENSFTNPLRVCPVEEKQSIQDNRFEFFFERNSFTILRIKSNSVE
ncbi:alpha-L-arabinofuranosidase C-terminal domain-containing protein [Pseudothermotoga sp. U03pept]|uniref:alpha-L-arabinofuranosidase C-terminal domain-containing protein n=1 Tax=Pseudothermotoga sp. U03pept TaxID=3447012 RepID=UPI003F0BE929